MPGITDLLHGALLSGRELVDEVVADGREQVQQITMDQALAMYERIRTSQRDVHAYARWQLAQVHPEIEDEDEIRAEARRYQAAMEREIRRRAGGTS